MALRILILTGAMDLLFPLAVGAVILRKILPGQNWRNLMVLAMVALYTLSAALWIGAFFGLPIVFDPCFLRAKVAGQTRAHTPTINPFANQLSGVHGIHFGLGGSPFG